MVSFLSPLLIYFSFKSLEYVIVNILHIILYFTYAHTHICIHLYVYVCMYV